MVRRVKPLVPSFICLFFVFATTLLAQEPPLETAWKLAAQGEHARAVDVLKDLLKREPANVDAHLLLGSLLSEDGDGDKAIAELSEAVRLRPKSSEAFNALGEAYQTAGDLSGARQAFEKAVALTPSFAVAQQNLGAVLLQQGEAVAAAKHLDLAIPLLGQSQDAADAYYLRAKIDSTQNQFPAAGKHLRQALAIRPDFAEAWSDLGVSLKATGDDAGALSALQKAVELNPQGSIAQYRLGAEYLHSAKPNLALPLLEAANRLSPDDQSTLNALQSTLQQLGRSEEAAAVRAKLAQLLRTRDMERQNNRKALEINNAGAALEKSGKLPEALSRYREAVTLSPDHVGIRTNYALALLRQGDWTQGLTELHFAVQHDPGNKRLKLVLQDALAKAPRELLPDWARTSQ